MSKLNTIITHHLAEVSYSEDRLDAVLCDIGVKTNIRIVMMCISIRIDSVRSNRTSCFKEHST